MEQEQSSVFCETEVHNLQSRISAYTYQYISKYYSIIFYSFSIYS